jgi:hypothetical protein
MTLHVTLFHILNLQGPVDCSRIRYNEAFEEENVCNLNETTT